MKLVHLIALIIFMSYIAKAQDQSLIDSLSRSIKLSQNDSIKADAYHKLGIHIFNFNPDSSQQLFEAYSSEMEEKFGSSKPDSRQVTFYNRILYRLYTDLAFTNRERGFSDKAIIYGEKALKCATLINDTNLISKAFFNQSKVYDDFGLTSEAIEFAYLSLKLAEKVNYTSQIGISINQLGTLNAVQGNHEQAMEYYKQALLIHEQNDDQYGIAIQLNNIGTNFLTLNKNDSALQYFERAISLNKERQNWNSEMINIYNIACAYQSKKQYGRALKYFLLGLEINESHKNLIGRIYFLTAISDFYLEQLKFGRAMNYCKEALELSKQLGYPEQIKNAALSMSTISRNLGKHQFALINYELYIQMRDSIKNEETQKATIRQQTKYEFEKAQLVKEQEEKEAARILAEETGRRDNLQYSVILIAILALFGGVLVLGFINVSERMAEGIIFFSFLILFEFLLVLADPYIEGWSGGAPGIKLLFNACIAALIFPAHTFFEIKLKKRLVKAEN